MIGCVALLTLAAASPADWLDVGNRAFDAGKLAEAESAYQFALRLSDPQADWAPRIGLAAVYLEKGLPQRASWVLRSATQRTGPAVERVSYLNALGSAHLVEGRLSAADAALSEARLLLGEIPPADRGAVLHNLSAVGMRTGRYAEALRDGEQAVALWLHTLDPKDGRLAKAWGSLSTLLYLSGRYRDAEQSLMRAMAVAETAYGASHPLMGDLLSNYAMVLDRLDRKSEAAKVRRRARGIGATPVATPGAVDVRELRVAGAATRSK